MNTTILKTLALLFISTLLLTSCNQSEPENDEEYYKIEGADLDYIPTSYQNIGEIITFRNQNDHEVRMKTWRYTKSKKIGGPGWISGYYYDHLWIDLELIDMEITGDDDRRYQSFQIEIIKQKEGDMLNRVHIPAIGPSGNSCSGLINEFYTPETTNINVSSMTINNVTYQKVLTFQVSGGWVDFYTLFNESTIHTVYYDMKHGIIGFDDTVNNLHYRLVN